MSLDLPEHTLQRLYNELTAQTSEARRNLSTQTSEARGSNLKGQRKPQHLRRVCDRGFSIKPSVPYETLRRMALVLNSAVSSDLCVDTVQKQLYNELRTSEARGNLDNLLEHLKRVCDGWFNTKPSVSYSTLRVMAL